MKSWNRAVRSAVDRTRYQVPAMPRMDLHHEMRPIRPTAEKRAIRKMPQQLLRRVDDEFRNAFTGTGGKASVDKLYDFRRELQRDGPLAR